MRNSGTNRKIYLTTKNSCTYLYIANHCGNQADKPPSDKLKQKNTFLLCQALNYIPEPLQKYADRLFVYVCGCVCGGVQSDRTDCKVALFPGKVKSIQIYLTSGEVKHFPGIKYHKRFLYCLTMGKFMTIL